MPRHHSATAVFRLALTNLPLAVTICQTNPSTGGCLPAAAASGSTTINADATPTFAVFATASGAVSFVPAANRIFVEFSGGGIVRGSTSVAVEAQ